MYLPRRFQVLLLDPAVLCTVTKTRFKYFCFRYHRALGIWVIVAMMHDERTMLNRVQWLRSSRFGRERHRDSLGLQGERTFSREQDAAPRLLIAPYLLRHAFSLVSMTHLTTAGLGLSENTVEERYRSTTRWSNGYQVRVLRLDRQIRRIGRHLFPSRFMRFSVNVCHCLICCFFPFRRYQLVW